MRTLVKQQKKIMKESKQYNKKEQRSERVK